MKCLPRTPILLLSTLITATLSSGVNDVNAAVPHTNRLANEKSPYLLQHAHNPVDWYPWGEEAFVRAREEDKPIFLSIGYSTCHWCHVMEEESFSDPDIAAVMNEHFVCIKVDREERPDVDKVYMTSVVSMTGQGGWPLTVFLTPDKRPFFGGTYFPPDNKMGMPGLKTVLLTVHGLWTDRRDEVLRSSEAMLEFLRQQTSRTGEKGPPLSPETLKSAYEHFTGSFDPRYGGFGPAPKFPSAHSLSFLLRYWKRFGEPQALGMVERTLSSMAGGGIYDHIGGGFHRYSTDEEWHVPHFEKMLYDQATLARAYVETFQATKNAGYAQTAREVFDYVLREMTGREGAFYSAEDADSPVDAVEPERKREGAFYVWTKAEIVAILGEFDAEIFGHFFGVEATGNVLHDPHGEFTEKNILHVTHPLEDTASRFEWSTSDVRTTLDRSREKLLDARSRRPRPHLDDKILVDWNGLMIASLSVGSRVLEEPRYLAAAERAAEFILENLVREDGRLLHTYRDGEARVLGNIEDYAFFVHGLLELYETCFKVRYLQAAKHLTEEMVRLFWDEEGSGFFFTASDAESLLVRQKELYDGAFPSGNSLATLNLTVLGRLTMEKDFESKAEALFTSLSSQVTRAPNAFTQLLGALDFALGPSREIVIVGDRSREDTTELLRRVRHEFAPNKVVVLVPPSGKEREELTALIPFLKEYHLIGHTATVYVCENYACKAPTTSPVELDALLRPEKEQ
jgi:uncharacterized protein YyaL (SSP411 family)